MKIGSSNLAIAIAIMAAGISCQVMPIQIIDTRRGSYLPERDLIHPEIHVGESQIPGNRNKRKTGIAKARRDSKKRRRSK